MQTRPRQPRQDDDEEESKFHIIKFCEEVGNMYAQLMYIAYSRHSGPRNTTTSKAHSCVLLLLIFINTKIFHQLATIVQAIFGQNVNVTRYVENASKLLPRPIGNQLVGVANLLDPSQFTSTATPEGGPVTPPPRKGFNSSTPVPTLTFPINSTLPSSENVTTSAPAFPPPPPPPGVQPLGERGAAINTESDEEEDEDTEDDFKRSLNRVKRQFAFKGIHPMMLIDGFESIWKNFGTPNATAAPLSSTAPPKKCKSIR